MTIDRKVMESVMRTHAIENISISFRRGAEVIPYLAPHEVRRLFGGTDPATAEHSHHHSAAK
jgi:urease accessory protein